MDKKKITIIVSVTVAAIVAIVLAFTLTSCTKGKNDKVAMTTKATTEATTKKAVRATAKATTEKATKTTEKKTTEKKTTGKATAGKTTKATTATTTTESTTTEQQTWEDTTQVPTEAPYTPDTEAPTAAPTEAPTERRTEAPATTTAAPTTTEAATTQHVHDWEVLSQETEDHDYCNTCGADITGISTKEHCKASGTHMTTMGDTTIEVYNCSGASHTEPVVVSTTWECLDCGETVTTSGESRP